MLQFLCASAVFYARQQHSQRSRAEETVAWFGVCNACKAWRLPDLQLAAESPAVGAWAHQGLMEAEPTRQYP